MPLERELHRSAAGLCRHHHLKIEEEQNAKAPAIVGPGCDWRVGSCGAVVCPTVWSDFYDEFRWNHIITGVVAAGGCQHATHADANNPGGLTVQLIPFSDTPNNGGEYKAWATPVADFLDGCAGLGVSNGLAVVDCGRSAGDLHGFVPRHSKTDNFKVKGVNREID